jgi:hypothetical protein
MDFSMHKTMKQEHKTMKRVEMVFTITRQDTVKQVKATEVLIMTALTVLQTAICPTQTTIEVSLQVQVSDHVLLMRKTHHRSPEKPLCKMDISAAKTT